MKIDDFLRKNFRYLYGKIHPKLYFKEIQLHPIEFGLFSYPTTLLSPEKIASFHRCIEERLETPKLEVLHNDPSVMKVCVFPQKNEYFGSGVICVRRDEYDRNAKDYIILWLDYFKPNTILHYLGHTSGLGHVDDERDVMYSDTHSCPKSVVKHGFGKESKKRWEDIRRYFTQL